MVKRLRIEWVPTYGECMRGTIVEQTHRNYEFGKDDCDFFKASNDWKLASCSCPEVSYKGRYLYCRGDDPDCDDDSFIVPIESMLQINRAVLEYNEFFS